jgi:hypothetical protein
VARVALTAIPASDPFQARSDPLVRCVRVQTGDLGLLTAPQRNRLEERKVRHVFTRCGRRRNSERSES